MRTFSAFGGSAYGGSCHRQTRYGGKIVIAGLWLLAAVLPPAVQAADRTWTGAAGDSNWFTTNNWNPADNYPQAGEAATITNGTVLLTNATAALGSFAISNATLMFTNWTTALTASNVVMQNGGVITHVANSATTTNAFGEWVPDARVYIVCTNLTLAADGAINADARGYAGQTAGGVAGSGYGPGGGQYVCGGGYGGKGGSRTTFLGGNPYGSANAPTDPGSGGGGELGGTGRGGGLVRVEAGGNVTIQGTIMANGEDTGGAGGGGAGGGILIHCQGAFSGSTSGVIRANGGSSTSFGGGGGGRIAVICTNVANAKMRFTASPGLSGVVPPNPTNVAGMGTLYFPDTGILSTNLDQFEGRIIIPGFTAWNVDQLAVSNGAISLGEGDFRLTVTNDLVIGPGGGLMLGCLALRTGVTVGVSGSVTNPLLAVGGNLLLNGGELTIGGLSQTSRTVMTVGGNLTLTNAGRMYVHSGVTNVGITNYGALVSVTGHIRVASSSWIYPNSQPTNGGSVLFRTTDLTVLTNGGFNADARGYAKYMGDSPGSGYGPGAGQYVCGGGYGGKGGDYLSYLGGNPYGSSNEPTDPGSSAGGDVSWPGTAGGGLVRVEAGGNVTIHGTITANSGNATGGSGSGGGIFIICPGLFSGSTSGVIRANGGTATYGSGGGGRIAVWYGVPEKMRARILAGESDIMRRVAVTSFPPAAQFQGTVSATNGVSDHTGGATDGEPGTLFFLTVSHQGTTLSFH